MSGHNKWSTIKHKKGAADAKRGKIFTKLIKEITVAARMGGGDQGGNPRLRSAIIAARAANMPNDNIDRAIKKGTGELEGVNYEEITYEGYGPGGVAMLVECVTDNRNRTVSEIRHMLSKHNGNMGETGCVSWMFSRKGIITIDKAKADEDKLMECALDAGADELITEGEAFEVHCATTELEAVSEKIKAAGFNVLSAEINAVPQNYVKIEGRDAEVMVKLMANLDDHDDVQHVWANFDIDDALLEKLSE